MTYKAQKALLDLAVKLLRDLFSVKVLVLIASCVALKYYFISDSVWGMVVVALLGMREFSETRQNYFKGTNDH